eukprot:754153-Hanusia_phi.AAC.5
MSTMDKSLSEADGGADERGGRGIGEDNNPERVACGWRERKRQDEISDNRSIIIGESRSELTRG